MGKRVKRAEEKDEVEMEGKEMREERAIIREKLRH